MLLFAISSKSVIRRVKLLRMTGSVWSHAAQMGGIIVTSSANQSRIAQARAWLKARTPAEELLVLAANADAANALVRDLALERGAAFGWHRLAFGSRHRVLTPFCLHLAFGSRHPRTDAFLTA
jgi:hypothetical protein